MKNFKCLSCREEYALDEMKLNIQQTIGYKEIFYIHYFCPYCGAGSLIQEDIQQHPNETKKLWNLVKSHGKIDNIVNWVIKEKNLVPGGQIVLEFSKVIDLKIAEKKIKGEKNPVIINLTSAGDYVIEVWNEKKYRMEPIIFTVPESRINP